MRKKTGIVGLMLLGILLLSSCAGTGDIEEFLVGEAYHLTQVVHELAANDQYIQILGMPRTDVINEIAGGDYTAPSAAYLIPIGDQVVKQAAGVTDPSPALAEALRQRINGLVFANMLNASYGVEVLSGTAALTWGKSYIQPKGWEDNLAVILEYAGDYSGFVSFHESGEGVISASFVFLKNGEMDVLASFGQYLGTEELKYEKLSKDEVGEILKKAK